MADKSGISWTDATWNPVTGCTRASAGCDHCYAVRMSARLERMGQAAKYGGLTSVNGKGDRHFVGEVRCHQEVLLKPLGWKAPRKIFVNSMSDTFHRDVPFDFLDRMFAVMALCPRHTFQVLTKRPERAAEYFADPDLPARVASIIEVDPSLSVHSHDAYKRDVCRNLRQADLISIGWVWIGTSVEDQAAADARIPHLLKIPARVRFLSCEPLIGPLRLNYVAPRPWDGGSGLDGETWIDSLRGVREYEDSVGHGEDDPAAAIHWVIGGGESGPNARFCNPSWALDLRDQCKAAHVPFHWKQWGAYLPDTQNPEIEGRERLPRDYFGGIRMGATKSGRLIDGTLHDAFPEVALAR